MRKYLTTVPNTKRNWDYHSRASRKIRDRRGAEISLDTTWMQTSGTHAFKTLAASFSQERKTERGAIIRALRMVPARMRPPM